MMLLSGCNNVPPVDVQGRPLIRKLGTVDCDMVETTPVVYNGRLYRFEYVRSGPLIGYHGNKTGNSYFRFVDHESGRTTRPFAQGYHLGSAFTDGDTVYVSAVSAWGSHAITMFASKDLENWESWTALDVPGFTFYNTSVCKANDVYVISLEFLKPMEQSGGDWTARFATSKDMKQWEMMPPECIYIKGPYSAPHCLRYLDGYFYNFHLKSHEGPTYSMHVVRSKDLIHWDPSPLNPVMQHSDEDKRIAAPQLTAEQRERIAKAENVNNSDMDFCEYEGEVIINYSWGSQKGIEHLGEAVYEGTLEQFLRGWYPEK